jgi:hypothetical protein
MTTSAIRKINVQGMKTAPRIRPNFSFRFILDKRETREPREASEKALDVCYLIGAWLRGHTLTPVKLRLLY